MTLYGGLSNKQHVIASGSWVLMPYSTAFSFLQALSETQTPVLSQDTRDVLELMPRVDRVTICVANVTKIVVRACRALVSLANQRVCVTTIAKDVAVNLQGWLLLFLLFAILHLLLHLGRCLEVPVRKFASRSEATHVPIPYMATLQAEDLMRPPHSDGIRQGGG